MGLVVGNSWWAGDTPTAVFVFNDITLAVGKGRIIEDGRVCKATLKIL